MDIVTVGLITALGWALLFVVVLGLCKAASGADAHVDYSHANDRGRTRERIRAHERMRPAAL
jgi:hypothetical protein